ncbi:MAG: hypothetical protein HKM93_00825 [Desulfobacteraceae bacterium]|nr:hypothetical protein [Desulfobacteraceae bacterium]
MGKTANAVYITDGVCTRDGLTIFCCPRREYQYDPLQRVTGITGKNPAGNSVMNYAYTYDAMDNITQKITEHGIYGYDYDDLYRPIDVANPAVAGNNEDYTYDAVGNRKTSADVSGDWLYNTNNELQSHGDVTYNYDVNGNTTEKAVGGVVVQRFFYNLEDRLERVEDGTGIVIAE